MTNIGQTTAPSTVAPTLIVLGRDDGGKAHASWFSAADAPLAEKAADMMGMAALSVATDEIRAYTGRLPQGRVFPSGKAFVPFVKGQLFDALVAQLPDGKLPAKADSVKRQATGSQAAAGSETVVQRPVPTLPEDWSKIVVGNMVLASEGKGEGWFEATVLKATDDGVFTLKWRDWLDYPPFTRRREQIALLHPKTAA